jgi:hypothetical protein
MAAWRRAIELSLGDEDTAEQSGSVIRTSAIDPQILPTRPRSAFPKFESYQAALPSLKDGLLVKIIHGGHQAILEFLFGCDTDMTQDGAGKFGEEALDQVEPGAVGGGEGELEAVLGLLRDPGSGLF